MWSAMQTFTCALIRDNHNNIVIRQLYSIQYTDLLEDIYHSDYTDS